ncbi:hypothetical protein IMG5_122950 [Ichthyophthirius multifiliis]|uniref:Anoctamin transmembrane domain-containing protein n=1 Tax=Ichthyophthirius multifiliis TaxID=5932 RepID=G0QVD4_ICHMU|nr:hypothetical protein IMG5_122950 [Ichthyophthirius multifiliis]EGR30823.1 hypothetical protein IMG5_122950 [Ichthyophthirius multifiliis]|eukprot:XP_004032410.1 hypothetical protein IMG5_122950 [Ichthyophthirius multifiliis]
MDEIRKICSESLIPYLIKQQKKKKKNTGYEKDITFQKFIKEIELWDYDDFDDYIEVVAQIAFICLFAYVSRFAVSTLQNLGDWSVEFCGKTFGIFVYLYKYCVLLFRLFSGF